MWTDNDDLADELKDISKVTEEKAWVSLSNAGGFCSLYRRSFAPSIIFILNF